MGFEDKHGRRNGFVAAKFLTLKFVPSRDANYSGGLLGMFAALAGSDPNPPVSPDDEQEQADLQTLEDRLSSSGNINDAWALYKARIASRRWG